MFCKHLLVYINSKVPFHVNLPPPHHLPSHRSGVPVNRVYLGKWSKSKTREFDISQGKAGLSRMSPSHEGQNPWKTGLNILINHLYCFVLSTLFEKKQRESVRKVCAHGHTSTRSITTVAVNPASLAHFTRGSPAHTWDTVSTTNSHPDVVSPAFLGALTTKKPHFPSPNFGHKGFAWFIKWNSERYKFFRADTCAWK
jgi:hypothetical protein